jgi:hypothetical protein
VGERLRRLGRARLGPAATDLGHLGRRGIGARAAARRPAFGLYRLEFPGECGVEFHPSHGEWIPLLRQSDFEIEDLLEVRPPAAATTRYPFVTVDWARQWPSEEVWKVRKRG